MAAMTSFESVAQLLAGLFTSGKADLIYEAFLDKESIDIEVVESIIKKITKENGGFKDVSKGTEDKDPNKFTGFVNLANGSVKFEIELRNGQIRKLNFGAGQEPESIPAKFLISRGVEFITLFYSMNAAARALMAELSIEMTPMQRFVNEMHMENNRIGFGKFKSATSDVQDEFITLTKESGSVCGKLNFTVDLESAKTTAQLTFGINGYKAEITDYEFVSSIISGGKMDVGAGKQETAKIMKLLLVDRKINEFLELSLHRDLLSSFDVPVFDWHIRDVLTALGPFKESIESQVAKVNEEYEGDELQVFGEIFAEKNSLQFTFVWTKGVMIRFNWMVADKSGYERSTVEIHRSFFENKTKTWLESIKNHWIGGDDLDFLPDMRGTDEMNLKKLTLVDHLELDEPLIVEFEPEKDLFEFNGFDRLAALKTKITLGGRVLEGQVSWFVDSLRAYVLDFWFTKVSEDPKAAIDLDGLKLDSDSEDEKFDEAAKFDFNWDD